MGQPGGSDRRELLLHLVGPWSHELDGWPFVNT